MMRSILRTLVFCCAAGFCCAVAATIPSGTHLEIRLLTPLNSTEAKPQQTFEAVVIAPVAVDGAFVVAQGTNVKGRITEVTVPQTASDQTVMVLTFDQL